MKKTLTKIFRSSDSFLRTGKTALFLVLAVLGSSALSAQFVPVGPSGTNVKISRHTIAPNVPGHVPSPAALEIKSGAVKETFSFSQFKNSNNEDPNYTYMFPDLYSVVGQPPLIRTFKVSFSNPILTSRYYPVPTAIEGSTTIVPGCWSPEVDPGLFHYGGPNTPNNPNNSFGYGVTLTRKSATEYLLQCTKFLCAICTSNPCSPMIPTLGKSNAAEQSKIKLYPNPSSGFSEFEYTASAKETITVIVSNIAGKTIYGYKTDIAPGMNKLPIDIQNSVSGTYYINWSSSNGNSGSLPIIKK